MSIESCQEHSYIVSINHAIMSVVEVTRWDDLDLDRALAATYAGGGIPTYWIVNIKGRQLEVYSDPQDGAYPCPRSSATTIPSRSSSTAWSPARSASPTCCLPAEPRPCARQRPALRGGSWPLRFNGATPTRGVESWDTTGDARSPRRFNGAMPVKAWIGPP